MGDVTQNADPGRGDRERTLDKSWPGKSWPRMWTRRNRRGEEGVKGWWKGERLEEWERERMEEWEEGGRELVGGGGELVGRGVGRWRIGGERGEAGGLG